MTKRIRNKFRPEEDEKLRILVKKHGLHSWEKVADEMKTKNVRQCRERWKHYLCCNDYYLEWAKEEDKIIIEKVKELGSKWTKISKFLPGRTDIQIKGRWLKKLQLEKDINDNKEEVIIVLNKSKRNDVEIKDKDLQDEKNGFDFGDLFENDDDITKECFDCELTFKEFF